MVFVIRNVRVVLYIFQRNILITIEKTYSINLSNKKSLMCNVKP